jgi:predicted KAP-like P-loop ATPase
MEFDWCSEKEGLSADKLDRAKYAKFLTNFLASRKNESYVMNLNAEWGAGKTYFLQRWFHEIQDAHPATYIDAWKNDFSEDPLLTVISAITETLESNCNVAAAKYKKTMLKKGARLMKQLAPALLKGVLKTYTGVDTKNLSADEEFKLDDFNDAAVKALEIGLSEHQEKIESLKMFKITISNWLKDVVSTDSEEELEKPMFVFIDELDRCRPTYAIELLETVKHLFDIPDLIFVIATDTEQLQHSVKSVYGEGFDASRYLHRFFNRSFSLKKPDVLEFIKSQKVFDGYLSKELLVTCDDNLTFSEETLVSSLAGMCESFDFDLRTVQQWLDQL